MRLDAEIAEGIPPESWPPAFVALMVKYKDASMDTVRAHGLAHAAFDARGDRAAAARALNICLEYSAHATSLHRESLISDAVVFHGRRQGRKDLAEQWLTDLPIRPHFPGLRSMAEAAVLQARGEHQSALRLLADAERDLRSLSNKTIREASLRELRKWRTELSSAILRSSNAALQE
jgi:hypothetical protein